MKVLVVGSGGREHALVWKIAQSPLVDVIYAAPGNPGIAQDAQCVDIQPNSIYELRKFAVNNDIDLTVVGPEAPLVQGIVDCFQRKNLKIFGPTQRAAEIEGSKVFAKKLMKNHGIPTAEFRTYNSLEAAQEWIEDCQIPVVIKADGLAAGKGVKVCTTREEALDAVDRIMRYKDYGEAGDMVVVEEFLKGEEVSILALTDSITICPLESSQDHKAIYDGDKGPNTGGMGAYSPAPVVSDKLMSKVEKDILVQTVHALKMEGRTYRGVLYCGLMINNTSAGVLEYNARFGDPETQPILMRMKSDIVPVLLATIDGTLEDVDIEWDERPAVCVVMASGGYPGAYEKGKAITGIAEAEALGDVKVFHAGTALDGGTLVTNGGRVLGVTAMGDSISQAQQRAYEAVGKIHFENAYFRTDIASKALR